MFFSVIGEDKRMEYVANKLYSLGCEINKDINNHVIILPPPLNLEYLSKLSPYFNNIKIIYGGSISNEVKEKVPETINLIDYLSDDIVVEKNAILTAMGIIKYAKTSLNAFNDLNVLVIGYGFCGKAISNELKKYNLNISVAVRNNKLKNEIESKDYNYVDLKSLHLNKNTEYQLIFNTVPAMILDSATIDTLNPSVKIFDIASNPGGVDFLYCKEKGIFAELILGIPGKEYPKEAGEIIADYCYNHYMNNFYNPPS